jgi:putative PIN family toxin of toxin-antitoxin system
MRIAEKRSTQMHFARGSKERKIELLVSPDILAEIETVLFYPRLKNIHQLDSKAIKAYLRKIELISEKVTPTNRLHIIEEDLSDNIFLECAVEGKADFIVSGDRHLKDLESYAGIRIMDPGTFLKTIQDES